jgi:hypothetical protein
MFNGTSRRPSVHHAVSTGLEIDYTIAASEARAARIALPYDADGSASGSSEAS